MNQIDTEVFSKDLLYHKNRAFNNNNPYNYNKNEIEEYNMLEFNLKGNNIITEHSQEGDSYDNEDNIYNKIKGLIEAINYAIYYLRIKGIHDDKYIIIFTDMINSYSNEDEQIKIIIENLNSDKEALFLLVGRNKMELNGKKNSESLILDKFGEKSEIIDFDNMNKIKDILSSNKIVKEHIFFPNEIYK